MAITSQTAPVFHGIKLAGNSAIENLSVSVVASDPAASIGGKLWVVDAVPTTSDQVLRYSFVDKTGAVQTAQVTTKAELDAEVTRAKAVEGTLTSLTTSSKTNLVSAINSEVTRATTAEGSVDFSTATGVVSGADSSQLTALQGTTDLTSAILAVNTRAVASEEDLQVKINNLLSNTDQTALNSLSEIVAAYQLQDASLDGAITQLATDRESVLADVLGSGFTYAPAVRDELGNITTPAVVDLVLNGVDTDITAAFLKEKTDRESQDNVIEASVGLQTDGSLAFSTFAPATMQLDFATAGVTTILGAIEAINTELKVGGSDALDAEILRATTAEGDLNFSSTTLTASDLTAAIIAEYTRATTKENALQTELDNTQTSAGTAVKADGTWNGYTLTNYINTATSLTNADVLLDTQLKTELDARVAQDDVIEASVGLSATGGHVARTGTNYIDGTTTIAGEITALDGALKSEETARIAADNTIEASAGLEEDGSYLANALSNYITTATTLKDADNKLDAALKAEENERIARDDAIEASVGLSATGGHVARTGTNYIDGTSSITGEITALDAALKAEENERIARDDAIEASVGLNADGTYNSFTTSNYLNTSTTIRSALTLLDTKVKELTDANQTTAGGVQAELDLTQTSLGTAISGTGAWTGFTGTNYLNASGNMTGALTALDTALDAEVTARKNDDAEIIAAINAGNYYVASPAATVHTITHNLNSDQIIIQVLVDQGDGTYANDIVPIAIDSSNAFTVYLSTSSAIRVSVMRMDDITISVD